MSAVFQVLSKSLSPQKAKSYLEHPYKYARTVNQAKVGELSRKMMDGRFHVAHIDFAVCGQQRFLVNGYRCCHAVVSSDKTVRSIVTHHRCETLEVIADLYAQFDRTPAQVARCYTPQSTLSVRGISLCGSALSWLKDGEGFNRSVSLDERAKLVLKNSAACFSAWGICHDAKHLSNYSVLAAMIETFRVASPQASQFWTSVKIGRKLIKSSPEFQLRRWLLEAAQQHSTQAIRREAYVRCVQCWNAYRRQETAITLRHTQDSALPEVA